MFDILQRYTISCVLRSLIVTWLVLTAVVCTLILGDVMDDLLKHEATAQQSVTYILCVLPQKTFIVFPAICLMGSLFGVLALARHNELAAIFAAGAGMKWLILPMVFVSIGIGVASFFWNEYVAAPLSRWGEQMMMTDIKKSKGIFKDYGLLKGEGNRFIQYHEFDREEKVLKDIALHEMRPGGGHNLFLQADLARWDETAYNPVTGEEGAWLLDARSLQTPNYKIRLDDEEWTTKILPIVQGEILPIEERPEDFGIFERMPIEMSYRELKTRIRSVEKEGGSIEGLLPDLQFKVAMPFSVVVLLIIGMASGSSTFLQGREGAARFTYPLGVCLIVLGMFYAVTLSFLMIGKMGLLTPIVSVWLPNVLFASAGGWMLLKQ